MLKKKHLLVLLLGIFALLPIFVQPAMAASIPIIAGSGEKIIKVMDLPDNDAFKYPKTGQHFDLGYKWSQFSILFLPITNEKGKYVGYLGEGSKYLDLDIKLLNELISSSKQFYSTDVRLPEEVALPFFDAYGGKLILALIVIIWLYSMFLK